MATHLEPHSVGPLHVFTMGYYCDVLARRPNLKRSPLCCRVGTVCKTGRPVLYARISPSVSQAYVTRPHKGPREWNTSTSKQGCIGAMRLKKRTSPLETKMRGIATLGELPHKAPNWASTVTPYKASGFNGSLVANLLRYA